LGLFHFGQQPQQRIICLLDDHRRLAILFARHQNFKNAFDRGLTPPVPPVKGKGSRNENFPTTTEALVEVPDARINLGTV